jgi:hypothetical protein
MTNQKLKAIFISYNYLKTDHIVAHSEHTVAGLADVLYIYSA